MSDDVYIRGTVIVAGGSGRRMGGGIPKQFLPLGAQGKPVIVHTVENFIAALDDGSPIVVAAAADEIPRLREIALRYGIWERIKVCEGGETRFGSVRNGLNEIGRAFGEMRGGMMAPAGLEKCGVFVAIHDGARPLAGPELIARAFAQAREFGSAIPYVRPADSFRMECGDGTTRVCDRERLMAVQTPQVFRYENISAAYDTAYDPRFTDDAGVYESAGFVPHMFEGDRRNIKITTPTDLALANALMECGA